ncbi:MAG: amidohydrolase family protein [Pyrinomonadaceae bacterium]|nr:amidohydrolase family protein [Pyrinomonadaceae bacterium]
MTTLYCARWVLPIVSSPITDGAVAVDNTRIIGVGERAALVARFPAARLCDFGEAAILPGFVNCHSHLELTVMRGFLEQEENNFFAWLRKLTVARLERMTPDDLYVSAAWGAVEAARSGVTCIGDASSMGATSLAALCDVGLRGTVYQEVFGPDARQAHEQSQKLRGKLAKLRENETPLVRVGVSPHAPYTVSAQLLELTTEYALAERLPLMMHAAESIAESSFMREGTGVFAEGLRQRGIEWRAPGVSTIQYLAELGVLERARPLLAHCITVDDQDIETIKAAGASIAHCPKSNAKLGHGQAPFASFLKRDLTVGLGSDSVASNNTCDMLEEARFAALLARIGKDRISVPHMASADEILFAATAGGARALGVDETGFLEEGAQADLTVVALNNPHQLPIYDPAAAIVFASSGRDVILTVVAGREVYREGRVATIDETRLRARIKEIGVKLRF